jgi:hypothetical protein
VAALVTGRVVDEQGHPLAGVAVLVDGPVPLPDVAQLTGADGAFTVTAPVPGRYRVGFRAAGRVPAAREIDVDDTSAGVLEIELGRSP